MPRGILTTEQRERQLLAIKSLENRENSSRNAKKMWATKDMTERNKKVSLAKQGSKHPLWKGNNADYASLHEWVRNHYLETDNCDICGLKKSLDAANVSGNYDRDNRNDWQFLCRKCHMLSDNRLVNLIRHNKSRYE